MKEGALHREWSLWNQWVLQQKITKTKLSGHCHKTKPDQPVSEKLLYDAYPPEKKPEKIDQLVNSMSFRSFSKNFIALAAILYILFGGMLRSFQKSCSEGGQEIHLSNIQHAIDDGILQTSLVGNQSLHEVIDIPYYPVFNLSEPVYNKTLLSHTFGLSWNKPVLVKYSPPTNTTFNRVALTLDTTVDGVQYDRLVHVYLNNNEIWRSSTIEPAGRLSHSRVVKDVTLYRTLFEKEGDLLIQLDNLVTPKLTGKFNVTLTAHYYNDQNEARQLPKFHPLTPSKFGVEVPPISYDAKVSVPLPEINANTTQLLMLLSTSGNSAEEFWYSNLLDEYKDQFLSNNRHFYGHGSCRVINVFVNGIRVHSTNPTPYIFTGGIAPSLWNSIVSTGAFDLIPYRVDLTPIIPLLWDESAELEIEISNCIDDVDSATAKSGIGSNWITSATLAIWEDETIDFSYGDIHSFDNSTKVKRFAVNPPFSGMLTQILKATYSNTFLTNLTHVFKDGNESNLLYSYENTIKQTSMIVLTKNADVQTGLYIPSSNTSIKVIGDDNSLLKDSQSLTNATLASKLSFLTPLLPKEIPFHVDLSLSIGSAAYKDDKLLAERYARENGTAEFTISPNGNHGTGSVLHQYTLRDKNGSTYNREALSANSTILYDNVTESIAYSEPLTDILKSFVDLDCPSTEELNTLYNALNTEDSQAFIPEIMD